MLQIVEQSAGHYLVDLPPQLSQNEQLASLEQFLDEHERETWAPVEYPTPSQALLRVYPPIQLPPSLALTYEVPPVQEVTENLLKSHLVDLQYTYATTEQVDRGARRDDRVTLCLWATQNGKVVPGSAQKVQGVMRNDLVFPGFFTKLLNMKAGTQKSFDSRAPAWPELGKWAQTKVTFHVNMQEVEAVTLPELNDEFAKKSWGENRFEDLCKSLWDHLHEKYQHDWQNFVRDGLVLTLAEQTQVDIPGDLFAAEQQVYWEEKEGRLLHEMGLQQAELQSAFERWAQVQKNTQESYVKLKTKLAIRALIQQENLEATTEEIMVLLKPFAERFKQPIERVYEAFLTEGTLAPLLNTLHREKAADFLVKRATLVSQGEVLHPA